MPLITLDLISAGLILVSADVSGASFDGFDESDREAAWDKCLHTLYRMVDVHPSARDYAIALSGLKRRHSVPYPEGTKHHSILSCALLHSWSATANAPNS